MLNAYTTDIENDLARFEEEEARHTLQVLRRRAGDAIAWTDGQGTQYRGVIEQTHKKWFTARITERETSGPRSDRRIHLAVAPTKNISRYEWFLEKATEIGIDEVTPLLCEHSERQRIRPDRLEKILLSAMKQSLRLHLPRLNALTPFQQFLDRLPTDTEVLMAHCADGNKTALQRSADSGRDVLLLIGPEGDFSSAEIELATQRGVEMVTLGTMRLRTETAAVVSTVLLNFRD